MDHLVINIRDCNYRYILFGWSQNGILIIIIKNIDNIKYICLFILPSEVPCSDINNRSVAQQFFLHIQIEGLVEGHRLIRKGRDEIETKGIAVRRVNIRCGVKDWHREKHRQYNDNHLLSCQVSQFLSHLGLLVHLLSFFGGLVSGLLAGWEYFD